MIELRGVSRRFGLVTALEPASISFEDGTCSVIIGPSGCGKSTLLRIINGLLRTDTGEVEIQGDVLTPSNVSTLRRKMGYVIQEGGLFPHLTAQRNVTLPARQAGWEPKNIKERFDFLINLVRLNSDAVSRYPAELSGGQRQRVSLMRALMLDPPILLLDEPLGALDPMIRSQLQQDLQAVFAKLHKTVVMVTHDLAEAAYFGDNIILMKEGRIIQRGPYKELEQAPAQPFVKEFVGAHRTLVEALG